MLLLTGNDTSMGAVREVLPVLSLYAAPEPSGRVRSRHSPKGQRLRTAGERRRDGGGRDPRLLPGAVHQAAPGTVLLRLETTRSREGNLDGAWWPRSRDLGAELLGLIYVLTGYLGPAGAESAAGVHERADARRYARDLLRLI